jgi:lysozyme
MHPVKTSESGLNLIKKFEGLHRVQPDGTVSSYRCPAGVWTAGWGTTYGVKSGTKWTVEECEERLRKDVQKFEQAVKRKVNVPLSQSQFDSLVSWTYNLGEGNLSSSTLLKKLNKGLYEDIPSEMMKWNKARVSGVLQPLAGLTRRRAAEASVFSMDASIPSDDNGAAMPQKVTSAAPKKLIKSKTMAGVGVAGTATMLGELAPQLQALVPYAASMKTIFLIVAVGGIALAAYARMKDHKEGVH